MKVAALGPIRRCVWRVDLTGAFDMLEGRSSPGELHCRIMSSHDTRGSGNQSRIRNGLKHRLKTKLKTKMSAVWSFFFPKQIYKKFISWGKQGLRSEIVGLTSISFRAVRVTLVLQWRRRKWVIHHWSILATHGTHTSLEPKRTLWTWTQHSWKVFCPIFIRITCCRDNCSSKIQLEGYDSFFFPMRKCLRYRPSNFTIGG